MAFENVYLTKKEKEEFKRRNIDGPYRPVIGREKLGFGGPFIKGTIDRERKIYLFYCGVGPYNFENPPEDRYFALVWDNVMGDRCAEFCMKYEIIPPSNPNNGYDVLWHLLGMTIPKGFEDKETEIVKVFKEAMQVRGLRGDPDLRDYSDAKFDF